MEGTVKLQRGDGAGGDVLPLASGEPALSVTEESKGLEGVRRWQK